jgi:hypothetical protein
MAKPFTASEVLQPVEEARRKSSWVSWGFVIGLASGIVAFVLFDLLVAPRGEVLKGKAYGVYLAVFVCGGGVIGLVVGMVGPLLLRRVRGARQTPSPKASNKAEGQQH